LNKCTLTELKTSKKQTIDPQKANNRLAQCANACKPQKSPAKQTKKNGLLSSPFRYCFPEPRALDLDRDDANKREF
jgi:hypothetical protein